MVARILLLALLAGCVTSRGARRSDFDSKPTAADDARQYRNLARERCEKNRAEFTSLEVCEKGFEQWCERAKRDEGVSEGDCLASFAHEGDEVLPLEAACSRKSEADPALCMRRALDPIGAECEKNPHGDYWGCVRYHEARQERAQHRRDVDDERATREMQKAIIDAGAAIGKGLNPPQTTCTSTPNYGGGFSTVCH